MQRIDILGHHRHLAVILLLEMGERAMSGVGRNVRAAEASPGVVVEIEHFLLVAMPGLDGRDVLQVDAGPQPVLVAKGIDAAFLGDARSGQHDDTGRQKVLMHARQSSAVLG